MKHYTNTEIFTSLENQFKELMAKVDGETEEEKAVYALHIMEKYYPIFKNKLFMECIADLETIYIFEPVRTYEIYKRYGICS